MEPGGGRTHNAAMLDKVREAIRRYELVRPGTRVLAAVSGGADSMALLHALHRLRDELALTLTVAHLDHGIRPDTADDLAVVRAASGELGLPLLYERVDVPARAREKRLNLEQAARLARREFLERAAIEAGAERIALGHTRTDVAETVLLHLLRGAGPRGLRGVLPCTPPYVRPLILVSRDETRAFCQAEGISFRDDPTNDDRRLVRNAIRLEVLPILARFNPQAEAALARAGRLCADAEEALAWTADLVVAEVAREGGLALDLLRNLPPSVQALAVRRAAEAAGAAPEERHVGQVLDAVAVGRGEVYLPGGVTARIGSGILSFDSIAGSPVRDQVWELVRSERSSNLPRPPHPRSRSPRSGGPGQEKRPPGEPAAPPAAELSLRSSVPLLPADASGAEVRVEELGWVFRVSLLPRPESLVSPNRLVAYFDPRRIVPPLVVRAVRPGDRLWPLGMDGTKRVGDLLMEARVPRWERARWPVIADGRGVAWVVGVRTSDDHRVMPDATEVLAVEARRL